MDKKEKLAQVAQGVKDCRQCPLWESATNPVPGEGSPDAEIVFLGEAPGYWEDQKGRPFVGQAGKLLDKLLSIIGVKRAEVFIGNVLKHRPPGNRDPLPEETLACKGWLDKQIKVIQPKMIVTLGRFAMSKFIPDGKITRIHGQPRLVDWQGRKIIVLPLFHPAAALRSGRVMDQTEEDFKKIPGILKNYPQTEEEVIEVVTEEGKSKEKKATDEQLTLL